VWWLPHQCCAAGLLFALFADERAVGILLVDLLFRSNELAFKSQVSTPYRFSYKISRVPKRDAYFVREQH
jgi:hypothetical protein